MLPAVILFASTYVLMLVFSKYRPYIALGSGTVFILTGMLPAANILKSLDFNVLLMIAGTMGLVELFVKSKMPALMADIIMEKVPNIQMAAVALSLFAGVISAFVDNVATVLMVAPVALEICKKLNTNPVPFIIGIAVSSNLQGAATLVGDTTAIMLGSALDMTFMDFFIFDGKPGMFFAVETGAIFAACILAWIFRKEKTKIPRCSSRTVVTDYVPTVLLAGIIVLLICISFIPQKPAASNGIICCVMYAAGLMYECVRRKNMSAVISSLKAIDFRTVGLLIGLFIMIGGISHMGVIDALAKFLARLGGGNVFLMYSIVVWASVLISAFIDNIPYVATMIPVIDSLAIEMGCDPTVFYFGLLSGATLGGNCTPIGASANITGIGILSRAGYVVKNSDFFKIGIPFAMAAIIPAYLYLWIFYGV